MVAFDGTTEVRAQGDRVRGRPRCPRLWAAQSLSLAHPSCIYSSPPRAGHWGGSGGVRGKRQKRPWWFQPQRRVVTMRLQTPRGSYS